MIKSFAFETTLSGLTYLNFIREAKSIGYNVTFFFVYLDNVELAKIRVSRRVAKGGHNIPVDTIDRRYKKGLKNFVKYAEIADSWYIYDNSNTEYKLVAESVYGKEEISNFDVYNKIIHYELR
jgi:predicted ABC-type ATPase